VAATTGMTGMRQTTLDSLRVAIAQQDELIDVEPVKAHFKI